YNRLRLPPCARPGGTGYGVRPVPRSGAEASLALGVGAQRPEEVDLAEVGPVGLAEVELAVRALPEQEAPEALLPGGADHQVGVRLALGVEVLGDVLGGDGVGELLEGDALRGGVVQQRADRVGDLAPAAVADGHVDDHPFHPGRAS